MKISFVDKDGNAIKTSQTKVDVKDLVEVVVEARGLQIHSWGRWGY